MRKRMTFLAYSMFVGCLLFGPLTSSTQETTEQNNISEENGSDEIRMNFKGADLNAVLDYLSEAAGFIIVKETDIEGRVDVWSYQPLNQEEVVDLLNTVLHEKGYAAIRNERTLTIVPRDVAKQKDIPVHTGNKPEEIPKTDSMVTQIVPVRYTDAVALIDNLQPLLPSYATMSANESSNAVIITDTQNNVRRMVQIIRSLDTSIANISTIKVYSLQFTEASDLAEIVNELFESDVSDDRGDRRGGRFPFGGRGGRDDDDNNSDSEARRAAARVVAVADENTNSLVVNAPEDMIPMIDSVVQQVDTSITDVTEIQVFQLEYADAYETAQQLQDLFPDESAQNQGGFAPRFGGQGGPGFFRRGGDEGTDLSKRELRQTTVRCVADPRTNSIIVTAASETMTQIAQMVQQLDSDSSRQQNVYVYHLQYADVDNVAEILRNIFESQNTLTNRNRTTNQNANTLSNRTISTDSFMAQQGTRGQ